MNRIFDLRFVIGLFFLVVGILLLIYSFTSGTPEAQSINMWCGIVFIVFGGSMILLSLKKEADDEIVE